MSRNAFICLVHSVKQCINLVSFGPSCIIVNPNQNQGPDGQKGGSLQLTEAASRCGYPVSYVIARLSAYEHQGHHLLQDKCNNNKLIIITMELYSYILQPQKQLLQN